MRLQAVTLKQANQAMHQLLEQPGYLRIEKPLLSYDSLTWIAGGLLGLIVIVLLAWRLYRKKQ
jgi:hypothetical protein